MHHCQVIAVLVKFVLSLSPLPTGSQCLALFAEPQLPSHDIDLHRPIGVVEGHVIDLLAMRDVALNDAITRGRIGGNLCLSPVPRGHRKRALRPLQDECRLVQTRLAPMLRLRFF
jgi:hypothetical protein